jgi:hypothetical protein
MSEGLAATLRLILGRGIGRRLLILILLFSSFVTLALTAGQLYLDYQRDVSAIERRIDAARCEWGQTPWARQAA